VLIFALIVLLVMTVLAISGVGNSTLEQRMAGNYSQSITAFQAAEQGLRAVEDWLFTQWDNNADIRDLEASDWWFKVTGTTDGLYSTMSTDPDGAKVCRGDVSCEFDPRDESQWCTDTDDTSCRLAKSYVELSDSVSTNTSLHTVEIGSVGDDLDEDGTIDTVARQPRFIIEYVGPMGEKAPVLTLGKPVFEAPMHAFRITVIAWGQDPAARHVLQSHVILASK
jgi:type IV pilus assembly protein PilX